MTTPPTGKQHQQPRDPPWGIAAVIQRENSSAENEYEHTLKASIRSAIPYIPTKQQQSLFAFHEKNCTHWAVVTTIFAPSEAVQEVATNLTGWCIVVVGDTKTPNNYADIAGWTADGRNDIVYLSVDQQNQMMRHPLVGMTPVRSFARKNLGYLFAILHGARIVFDFDDDNVLTRDDRIVTGPSYIGNFSRLDASCSHGQ